MARILRYVTTDAMGSVTSVLSSTGEVLERRSYDAFGQMTCMLPDGTPVATSPTGLKVGFHGQLMDQLTGMYQMGYRWYSPVLGRWVSREPFGLEGGGNLAGFSENEPNSMGDTFGTIAVDIQIPSPLLEPSVVPHIDPLSGRKVEESGTYYLNHVFECLCECVDGRKWMVKCTVGFKANIMISIFQAENLGVTLAGVYGHEQRHIRSEQFRWLTRLIAPIQSEPKGFFDDNGQCLSRAKEVMVRYSGAFKRLVLEAKTNSYDDHVGSVGATHLSPVRWAPYDPLPGSPFPK
jgi:RHS repeat-associated protein